MMKTLINKTKRTARRIHPLYLLTLLPLFSACYDYDDENRAEALETVPLTFYLQTAEQHGTRANVGNVPNESGEGTFYDVRVWLFDNNDTSNPVLLDYQQVTNDSKKVVLNVPKYIISQDKAVDAYIIANAPTVGLGGLNNSTTIPQLEAATLGGSYFTPGTPTTSVPATGLPYACILRKLKLANADKTDVRTDIPQVVLTRAVSKVRFAFAKVNGNTEAEIIGIKLNENLIAQNEYILPKDPATNTADYTLPYWGDLQTNLKDNTYYGDQIIFGSTNGTATYLTNENIRVPNNDADPSALAWENNRSLTAEAYENLIVSNTTNSVVYLHESDKKLSGTIYYRLQTGGDIFQMPFEMDATSTVQDFARNHEWIVYGYFSGHKLVLRAYVINWYYWLAETSYTENVTMTQQLQWTNYQSITNQEITLVDGHSETFQVVALRPNGTVTCSFIFDTPYRGTWMAMLESVNDTENDAIVFADGTTVQSGTVGSEVTLTIKPRNANSTSNHYSRLRFVCYSESGDLAYAVGSETLGGNYLVAQYAN